MDCATIVKRGYLFDKKIGIIPVPVVRVNNNMPYTYISLLLLIQLGVY